MVFVMEIVWLERGTFVISTERGAKLLRRRQSGDVTPHDLQNPWSAKLFVSTTTRPLGITPMSSSAQSATPSGTRQRKSNLQADLQKQDNLPAKRQGKAVRQDIRPPFWNTPYQKFTTYITIAVLLIGVFYTWRLLQWKTQAGGWFNLVLGKHPNEPVPKAANVIGKDSMASTKPFALEDRIQELADELGIHPRELASAIKPLIPVASVTSLAHSDPTASASGSAVSILADEATAGGADYHESKSLPKKVMAGLGGVVGLDEPVDFDGECNTINSGGQQANAHGPP